MSTRICLIAGIIFLAFSGFQKPEINEDESDPTDSVFYFKGRVLEATARMPVAFAHVINTRRKIATICDTLGYFYLRVRLQDTLNFTAIGFAPVQIIITDSLQSLEKLPDIFMREFSYSIEGVMINPLGSYQTFRSRVINLELPPSKYEINPTVLADIEEGTDTLDMMPVPGISPVTALYNWLSKEGKEKRKLRRLVEQEQFEKDIAYKYSPLIISGVTGYAGFELYSFMDFCSFSKKFLQESDRYEIRDAVVEKQKIYEALRVD
ncbi:MAG: hypothetical protein KAT15_12990 [Bacteroidales bacterium]|nr:hypothetical protein [Bacteroidales bacterium]